VRPLQNKGKMPIVMDDTFGKGIHSLISAFYPNLGGVGGTALKGAAGRGFSLLGIKFKMAG
jgi:hypothetical protein